MSIPKVFPESPRRDLFVDLEEECKDPDLFILPTVDKEEEKEQSISTSSASPPDSPPPKKPTSLSMNDLDLIHKRGHPDDLEETFILPVKSESTMSLYRLNVEQDIDQTMTPSRSETNVNGDSGFGSGAQSTNPVWSGFLCRKPSDPFWNMRKPSTVVTTPTRTNHNSGIMHSRMRKIPWISAWKKLDENSRHQQQKKTVNNDDSPLEDDGDILGWKENLVYEANGALAMNNAIDEELSDVGTPMAIPSDYNLNVFAKESGILMENAYGKIVRDDSGVQVNFYSKNGQHDDGMKDCFERSVEPSQLDRELFGLEQQNGVHSKPFVGLCDVSVNPPVDVVSKVMPVENIFCGMAGVKNEFKCEPRLNGGHYENLFGTKENIFAQCDPHVARANNKVVAPECHVEKRSGKDHFSNGKTTNAESVYGQLNKPEQLFGNSRNIGRSPSKTKELRRRESDNRGNRCGIKRRESRTRSDPRPNLILETNARMSFAELGSKFGNNFNKPSVEIEMKNVRSELVIPESRLPKAETGRNLNSREAIEQKRSKPESSHKQNVGSVPQAAESNAKVERRDSRNRDKDCRRPGVERKQSGRKEHKDSVSVSDPKYHSPNNVAHVERRVSQLGNRKESGLPVRVERRNSDRMEKPLPIYRRDDSKTPGFGFRDNASKAENRNEGLWVNAIPFQRKDEENGNSPRKGSTRKEKQQQSRSPRKSNLPRRESSGNDNKARVKRKTSGNRGRSEDIPAGIWGTPKNKDSDDFGKLRDKCEDNFGHIQNLNRECERRLDQVVFCGKMNGNVPQQNGEAFAFETFQETDGRGQHVPAPRPTKFDDNDNCRERKLAITDFL